ncbi:hypothetical protein [Bacillus sp. UNC41MFS5]|uniref:hypothetical protein n=1 Tax=Bacillus sp. UNC41MFS5 TaxID=1449046 RepID=UPI000690F014|nr:hypothetical protein [Bacillus sp. UNC41MFS5]
MANQSFFNGINSSGVFPFVNIDNDANTKLNEDQYEVYVNDNLVGHKTLKNPGEKLSDIDGFLHNQGLSDFSTSLDGDHYQIQTNEQDDITNALSVYFNNR